MSVQPRRALPLEALAESCTCCSTPTQPMSLHESQTNNDAPPVMALGISDHLSSLTAGRAADDRA